MIMTVSSSNVNDSQTHGHDDLLATLQRSVSKNIQRYQVVQHIVQANAEGFNLVAETDDGDDEKFHLFVKRVEAEKYANRAFSDLRRTLMYARTEARFYSDILPLLLSGGPNLNDDGNKKSLTPRVYLAEINLDGLIGEHESASAKVKGSSPDPVYSENNIDVLQQRGGLLVMDSIIKEQEKDSLPQYFQASPLTPAEAKETLTAIAKFHAMGFQRDDILTTVSKSLCEHGGSYHLKNRNPRELKEIENTWIGLVQVLSKASETPEGYFDQSSIKNLGRRIFETADFISKTLSPAPSDNFATIVHGDYKAMNVFLPKNNVDCDLEVILIDFASTGIGLGVSDVAMHVIHALHPKNLRDGSDIELFSHYYKEFDASICKHQRGKYPYDLAMKHFKYAIVDYFRFVLGRLWRGATLARFDKIKENKNAVFVNRDIEAALHFIELTDRYLTEIEEELASSSKR